ncbi:MAG TPA: cytochrome c [Candidatus Kapabacteria bacterium]|nr:cytochrome c [Candidatus Kapabacteria bacterium]
MNKHTAFTMAGTSIARLRRAARIMMPLGLLAAMAVVSGCRVEMFDQPRIKPLRGSEFYPDSSSARPYIKGTVERNPVWSNKNSSFAEATGGTNTSAGVGEPTDSADAYAQNLAVYGGDVDKNGSIPFPVTRELVERGQDRFNIYCTPCHGHLGDGNGMIVQRGFPQPPSFHIDRLRQAADGYIYDVITNGFGKMYSYASRVVPEDRWAIIAYIRALQLSQHASLQDVPAQERNKVEGSAQ